MFMHGETTSFMIMQVGSNLSVFQSYANLVTLAPCLEQFTPWTPVIDTNALPLHCFFKHHID